MTGITEMTRDYDTHSGWPTGPIGQPPADPLPGQPTELLVSNKFLRVQELFFLKFICFQTMIDSAHYFCASLKCLLVISLKRITTIKGAHNLTNLYVIQCPLCFLPPSHNFLYITSLITNA